MIRAVIFDYGDTLVRRRRPWEDVKPKGMVAIHYFFAKAGLGMDLGEFVRADDLVFREFSASERRQSRDIPDRVKYQALVRRLFPRRHQAWVARVARDAAKIYWDEMVKNYHLARGAKQTLAKLESVGIAMGVISNISNHEGLVSHLDDLGVGGFFTRVFSSSEVGVRKPDKEIFARCLREMNLRPREAIYAGNSLEHDVTGAKRAGMTSVWVDVGPAGSEGLGAEGIGKAERSSSWMEPDFAVKELAEIPPIVVRLNQG